MGVESKKMKKIILILMFVFLLNLYIVFAEYQYTNLTCHRYTFDDADIDGSNVTDTLNERDGVIQAQVLTGKGGFLNEAFCFDGSQGEDNLVVIPKSSELNVTDWDGNFTLSVWLNITSTTNSLFFEFANEEYMYIAMQWECTANNVAFMQYDGAWGCAETTNYVFNVWQHYTFVRNQDAGSIAIYINGSLKDSQAGLDVLTDKNLNNYLNRNANSVNWCIDDLVIWDRTLTATEILNMYNNYTAGGDPFAEPPPPADDIFPNLVIEYPNNNSYIYNISINGTASDDVAVDSTWVNDSRFTNEGTDETFSFVNNTGLTDGNYSVNVTTNDTSNNQNISIIDFIIDTILPNWTINSINLYNSSNFYPVLENITLNDSAYDIHIRNATINITNSTRSLWNTTIIATNRTINFSDTIDISLWGDGTYNISFYATDATGRTQTEFYTFTITTNTPPVIAGLMVKTDPIIKRETQIINFISIDDYDNDSLTLVCCKDEFNGCIPTLSNNILTGGNRNNQTDYTLINGTYAVGIEPYEEFIRCRVYGGNAYSNLVSNSYMINSSDTDPIIFEEYFRYSDSIDNYDWYITPYNLSIIPTSNHTLFLNQNRSIILTKYFNRTKIPLATVRFNLNITNGTDAVGFGIYRWDEDETYKLIPETIVSLTFYEDRIYYQNKSIGHYNVSANHLYELNLFFKTTKEYYDNISKEIEQYNHDTFVLKQDDIVITQNIALYTTTLLYDDYYFDRLILYKAPDTNITLDTILVYEGDNLVYNNIFEVLNPANETGYLESFGGFEETHSYDFNCALYPKCCEWVTRKNGTMVQVASKSWCVFGTVVKGWVYGAGNKRGLIYYIENNLWGFIGVILFFVLIYPVYIALQKFKKGGEKP